MPAALIVPISGPYTSTWNSLPLGTQNDSGWELELGWTGQEVRASDAYGLTLVEGIWRGLNCKFRFTALEWNKTGLLALHQMFGGDATGNNFRPILANIGTRWSTYCKTLVMTSILPNPPATPQTLTALLAGLTPNSTSRGQWTSKVREAPLEMVLLPYDSGTGNVVIPFSTT